MGNRQLGISILYLMCMQKWMKCPNTKRYAIQCARGDGFAREVRSASRTRKKNTAKLTNRHDKQNVSRKIWKTSCRTRSRERCKNGSGNKMATQWSAQKQEILNINLSTFAWQRFFRVFSLPVFLYAYLLVRWWCFVFVGFFAMAREWFFIHLILLVCFSSVCHHMSFPFTAVITSSPMLLKLICLSWMPSEDSRHCLMTRCLSRDW